MAGKQKITAAAAIAAAGTTAVAEHPAAPATAATEAPKKVTLSGRAKELFLTTPIDVETRGRAFRKTILDTLQKEIPGTSIASAAGAYNNAKTEAQKANPEKFACLGREPGKNNGGPKKRPAPATESAETAETATA